MTSSTKNDELKSTFFPPDNVDITDLNENGKLLSDDEIALAKKMVASDPEFASTEGIKLSKRKIFPVGFASKFSVVAVKNENEQEQFYAVYKGKKSGKELGEGAFGVVKLAQNLYTGEWVALKTKNDVVSKESAAVKPIFEESEETEVQTAFFAEEAEATVKFVSKKLNENDYNDYSKFQDPTYVLSTNNDTWELYYYADGEPKGGVLIEAVKGLKEKLSSIKADNITSDEMESIQELIKNHHSVGITFSDRNDLQPITGESPLLNALGKGKGEFNKTSKSKGISQAILLMKLETGVSLRKFLKTKKMEGKLSSQNALKIIDNVLDNAMELNRARILHRDIKPANIMINSKRLETAMVDFGESVQLRGELDSIKDRVTGTPAYADPTILAGMEEMQDSATSVYVSFSEKTEIYSIGRVIEDILAQTDIQDEVLKKLMQQFVARCKDADQDKRPTIKEAKEFVHQLKISNQLTGKNTVQDEKVNNEKIGLVNVRDLKFKSPASLKAMLSSLKAQNYNELILIQDAGMPLKELIKLKTIIEENGLLVGDRILAQNKNPETLIKGLKAQRGYEASNVHFIQERRVESLQKQITNSFLPQTKQFTHQQQELEKLKSQKGKTEALKTQISAPQQTTNKMPDAISKELEEVRKRREAIRVSTTSQCLFNHGNDPRPSTPPPSNSKNRSNKH